MTPRQPLPTQVSALMGVCQSEKEEVVQPWAQEGDR